MIMFVKQISRSVTGHASGFLLTGVKTVLAITVEDNFFPRHQLPKGEKLGDGQSKEHSCFEERVFISISQNKWCHYVLRLNVVQLDTSKTFSYFAAGHDETNSQ